METPKPAAIGSGLIVREDGSVGPPQIVLDAYRAGHSVIPMSAAKRPLVEWKEYQERQPTIEEIRGWIQSLAPEIMGWARVTGERSGVIVVDFDGKQADTPSEWGLKPHVKTGSGGYHLIVKHPGWRVKTCNSKSGKKHKECYPNIDIRGDGGYSLIAGFNEHGGYTWLRDPEDVDELDVLPLEFRAFFGLMEGAAEAEPLPIPTAIRERSTVTGGGPTPENLVERALSEATLSGRNNGGYWLALQLHYHEYERAEILEIGERYVAQCSETNLKGEPEAYTMGDFQRSVDQAIRLPRKNKWGEDDREIIANFGPELPTISNTQPDTAPDTADTILDTQDPGSDDKTETVDSYDYTSYRPQIDGILVPTEIGSEQRYAPWTIQNFLRVGNRGILYGIAGAAKSYVAVDLARAAVTHSTWLTREVLPGSVIYIAGEDALGVHHRVEASIRHFGAKRHHQVRVLEHQVAMTDPEVVRKLLDLFDYLPEKPTYVILDNLSLCLGGMSPNDGQDAKAFVDGCQMIQDYKWRASSPQSWIRDTDQIPITVVIIHHANKAGDFNGSQYFINLVDAMSELSWDGKEITRTLWPRKQRHGKQHDPLSFDLHQVDPVDELCVVMPKVVVSAFTEAQVARRKLTQQEVAILDCLLWAHREWQLARQDDAFALEGLQRGQITLRSKVAAGSMSKFLSRVTNAGLVEIVPVEVERGEPKPPNRYRLTAEGHDVMSDPEIEALRRPGGSGAKS